MNTLIARCGAGLLGLLALTWSTEARAGWHARQAHTDPKGNTTTADIFYDHHRLRIDTPGQPSVVIDLRSGDFTMIDHAKKQHTKATLQELVAIREEGKARFKERIAKMSGPMRKQLEKALADQEAAMNKDIEIKQTAKTGTVLGTKCRYFQWTSPEGNSEACIAKKVSVDMSPFKKDAEALSKKLKASGAGTNAATSVELLQLASKGFPLKTHRSMSVGAKTIEAHSEVKSLDSKTLPRSTFEAPKNYKAITFRTFIQAQAAMANP